MVACGAGSVLTLRAAACASGGKALSLQVINHCNPVNSMKKLILACGLSLAVGVPASAQVQTEYLNRGVVAVPADKGVFVSWRSLATDDKNMVFDVYRDRVKKNHKTYFPKKL